MGLFSKKPRPLPFIKVGDIKVWFNRDEDNWDFTYKGIEFSNHGVDLVFPSEMELDAIIADIERLTPEMKSRITEPKNGSSGFPLNEGESFSVQIRRLKVDATFELQWSDGETWGDMGIFFDIRDHSIVAEQWVD